MTDSVFRIDSDFGVNFAIDYETDSGIDSGTDFEIDSGTDFRIDSGTDFEIDSGNDPRIESGAGLFQVSIQKFYNPCRKQLWNKFPFLYIISFDLIRFDGLGSKIDSVVGPEI